MKYDKLFGLAATCSLTLGFAPVASAALIDFESVPGGNSDNLALSTQYQATAGVSFYLDNDLDGNPDPDNGGFLTPFLEQVGGSDPINGFINDRNGLVDEALQGTSLVAELGNWFLRTRGLEAGGQNDNLLIVYDTPTSFAGGQIWDIDADVTGNEKWLVEIIDSSNMTLDNLMSPEGILATDPSSLDSQPWQWTFDRETADISKIRISFVGTKPAGSTGLAFDNFQARDFNGEVPEPSLVVGLLAVAGLGATAKGKSKSQQ